jgi:hypothetical protein
MQAIDKEECKMGVRAVQSGVPVISNNQKQFGKDFLIVISVFCENFSSSAHGLRMK